MPALRSRRSHRLLRVRSNKLIKLRRARFAREAGALPPPSKIMKTILLLTISNIFMTLAWYGHLKFKSTALWVAILASWGIALFEYIFQVPANRLGAETFTVTQLKII